MLGSLFDSTNRILVVSKSEIHTTRRRSRFWVLCAILTLLGGIGYRISSTYLLGGEVHSPTFGIASPRYLLGNISPYVVMVFQLGALVLLLDSTQRHARDRIEEVLKSKSVTHFEYLVGRVLGAALLLWVTTFLIVSALQVVGLVSNSTGIPFSEPFQIHSMLNLLLLDAPVSFVVWCSVIVFLSNVLRLRVGVLVVGIVLIMGWSILVSESPYSLLGVLSASSNDSLFVSEISPQFASLTTIGVRIASLFFAGALLMFASLVVRIDGMHLMSKYIFGGGLLVLSCVLYGFIAWGVIQHYYLEPERWREVHESQLLEGNIDVLDISGSVRINPKTSMYVDLELLIKAEASETLMFTLNPAMQIQEVTLDDQGVKHSFQYGLLTLERGGEISREEEVHRMRIVAQGVPDPRFGYFNSTIDYLTNLEVPARAVALLGKDGSIYDEKFIALMSGVHWYPASGSSGDASNGVQLGKDFFSVDLTVELEAKNWQLVGAGTKIRTKSGSSTSYQVKPEYAVSEINLFASQFENATLTNGNVTLNLNLHKKHARNLEFWQGDLLSALHKRAEWLQTHSSDRELSLPALTINLVEVPDRLRTVGGGLRMKSLSTLPEIGLLKERGFPTVNIELAISQFASRSVYGGTEEEWRERYGELMLNYFFRALGTDNPFLGFAERYWTHHTSASGEFAEVLDEVILALLTPSLTPFSIYSTFHVAELSQLMPSDVSSFSKLFFISQARLQEQYFGSRLAIWNEVEQTELREFHKSEEYQMHLELVLLKARQIARGLRWLNDEEKLITWLTNVRNENVGNSYTLNDLIDIAKIYDVQVDPCLTSWLTASDLPAYIVSPLTVVQVANSETGNRQFQTSVDVRNVRPVDGIIHFKYPTQLYADELYWSEWFETPGVRIEAESAKRLNITTPYELRQVQFNPGLSLDRQSFVIHAASTEEAQWQNVAPQPFVEDSDWNPDGGETIVVDDLDDGFGVSQSRTTQELYISINPTKWFNKTELTIFEDDNGLPVYTGWYLKMPKEVWYRRLVPGAYGVHRKTTAIAWAPRLKPPGKVSFVAQLQTSGTWMLEYHLPIEWEEAKDFSRRTYNLRVRNAEKDWSLTFNTNSKDVSKGWNLVEELDLKSGTVALDVLGTASPGLMFADAIRWTKLSDD